MAKKELNLTEVQQLAINKLVSADTYKKINSDLKPGKYPVSMAVRITGEITKGEKYNSKVHLSVDWCKLFAYTLSKLNGATVESIVTEYLAAAEVDTSEIKKQAQAAVDSVKGLSDEECNGKLTAKLDCEIIETLDVEVK